MYILYFLYYFGKYIIDVLYIYKKIYIIMCIISIILVVVLK